MSDDEKKDQPTGSLSIFGKMELPYLPLNPQRILLAPLNWGLGHATRSADVVERLQRKYPGAVIILASDGVAAAWLRLRFPERIVLDLPGYRIRYAPGCLLIPALMLTSPLILFRMIREYRAADRMIREHDIDLVISDNRYGVCSRRCFSVFITHQIRILEPGKIYRPAFRVLNRINRWWINRYNQCWIPDMEEPPGLAGDLSHPADRILHATYMGPLSRFRWTISAPDPVNPPELLCLVSGPEPHRTHFLNDLIRQLEDVVVRTVILAGVPGRNVQAKVPPHVTIYPHLPDQELLPMIRSCRWLISRSGYSTIMDLHFAGARAFLIPTPGQTEQEYLGTLGMQSGSFVRVNQKDLDLKKLLR